MVGDDARGIGSGGLGAISFILFRTLLHYLEVGFNSRRIGGDGIYDSSEGGFHFACGDAIP